MSDLPTEPLTPDEFDQAQQRAERFSIGADIEQFDTAGEFNSYLAARKATETGSFVHEERTLRKLAAAVLLLLGVLKFADSRRIKGWA